MPTTDMFVSPKEWDKKKTVKTARAKPTKIRIVSKFEGPLLASLVGGGVEDDKVTSAELGWCL